MRRIALFALPCLALIALAVPNFADDKPAGKDGKMDPEMQKMMEECMKLGQPGEQHKFLTPMAGQWNFINKFRMSPDAEWAETKGTQANEMIFGGRYLSIHCKGDPFPIPGMEKAGPFEGMGLMGYDNMKKKFVCTWADNMSTMLMVCEGTSDSSGREITFRATMPNPMTKKDMPIRMVYKIHGDSKFSMQWYEPSMTDGKEFNSMEITYTKG